VAGGGGRSGLLRRHCKVGEGRAVARAVVVAESCAKVLLIGRERRWRGRGRWPAGELRG